MVMSWIVLLGWIPPRRKRLLVIEDYQFGAMTIGGVAYRKDLKIWPDGVQSPWIRAQGHLLQPDDLPELEELQLTHLVIGCGAQGIMKVAAEALKRFEELGLAVTALATGDAVAEFNRLLESGAKVGGAFHLTC